MSVQHLLDTGVPGGSCFEWGMLWVASCPAMACQYRCITERLNW
jgi:hypothetical protein